MDWSIVTEVIAPPASPCAGVSWHGPCQSLIGVPSAWCMPDVDGQVGRLCDIATHGQLSGVRLNIFIRQGAHSHTVPTRNHNNQRVIKPTTWLDLLTNIMVYPWNYHWNTTRQDIVSMFQSPGNVSKLWVWLLHTIIDLCISGGSSSWGKAGLSSLPWASGGRFLRFYLLTSSQEYNLDSPAYSRK